VVAAVVLHEHHMIIRVGAGLIQFVHGSHSRMAADLTLDKNLFSLPFSRVFSTVTALQHGTWMDEEGFKKTCIREKKKRETSTSLSTVHG